MNLLDLAILAILALFCLSGFHKGFLPTVFSVGSYLASCLLGMLLMPLVALGVKSNVSLYNTMLYYTEGSEFIKDIELARTPISSIGAAQLQEILSESSLPYPMGKQIPANVATEAFAPQGVITLGDYFNQTIVCVFINILVFLLLFVIIRVILLFVINGIDYAWKFPKLHRGDMVLGGGIGIIHGILAVFLVFMLLPILITILGDIEVFRDFIEGSFFVPFFYHSNFLLSLIPGV